MTKVSPLLIDRHISDRRILPEGGEDRNILPREEALHHALRLWEKAGTFSHVRVELFVERRRLLPSGLLFPATEVRPSAPGLFLQKRSLQTVRMRLSHRRGILRSVPKSPENQPVLHPPAARLRMRFPGSAAVPLRHPLPSPASWQALLRFFCSPRIPFEKSMLLRVIPYLLN